MEKYKLIDALFKKGYTPPKKKDEEEVKEEPIVEPTPEPEPEEKEKPSKFPKLTKFFKDRGGMSNKLGVAKTKGKFKFGR